MGGKKEYPFINPIIVSEDGTIIDGQKRYTVCQEENYAVEYERINFTSDQLKTQEAISKIREIQRKQKIKLEYHFKEINADFKYQLEYCSSSDRMEKFFEYHAFLFSDEDYWTTLADCYNNSNNNTRFSKKIKEAFSSSRPKREMLMDEKEREALRTLPDSVTIYRGMSTVEEESGDYGISWSLNKAVAKKFADEYYHNYETRHLPHIVKELTVNKNDIIALFLGRKEEEVIYIHNK